MGSVESGELDKVWLLEDLKKMVEFIIFILEEMERDKYAMKS